MNILAPNAIISQPMNYQANRRGEQF